MEHDYRWSMIIDGEHDYIEGKIIMHDYIWRHDYNVVNMIIIDEEHDYMVGRA